MLKNLVLHPLSLRSSLKALDLKASSININGAEVSMINIAQIFPVQAHWYRRCVRDKFFDTKLGRCCAILRRRKVSRDFFVFSYWISSAISENAESSDPRNFDNWYYGMHIARAYRAAAHNFDLPNPRLPNNEHRVKSALTPATMPRCNLSAPKRPVLFLTSFRREAKEVNEEPNSGSKFPSKGRPEAVTVDLSTLRKVSLFYGRKVYKRWQIEVDNDE